MYCSSKAQIKIKVRVVFSILNLSAVDFVTHFPFGRGRGEEGGCKLYMICCIDYLRRLGYIYIYISIDALQKLTYKHNIVFNNNLDIS